MIAPYKRPEKELPDNETFNNHVSIVRIRSEHAIGFLKGRFHSLKNLRVDIRDRNSHKIATYWVTACIGLHAFAMMCEDEEKDDESDSDISDPFIAEGLSSDTSDSDINTQPFSRHHRPADSRLRDAKIRREKLKRKLFRAMQKKARVRARRRVGLE